MTKSIIAIAATCLGLGIAAPLDAEASPRGNRGYKSRSGAAHRSARPAVRTRRSTPARRVTSRTQRTPRYRTPTRTRTPRYRTPPRTRTPRYRTPPRTRSPRYRTPPRTRRHRRIWHGGRYIYAPVFTAQSPAQVVITNNQGYGIQVRVRSGASAQCAYNPVTTTRWLAPGQSMALSTFSAYVCARSLGGASPYAHRTGWQIQAVVSHDQRFWL